MHTVKTNAPPMFTPSERRLLCLLAQGQKPPQAAESLHLTPEEAEQMLAGMLRRNNVSELRRLLVRALVHGWLRQ